MISVSGQSPFVYNWSTGASTEDLSGLLPGDYDLTVTNVYGCEETGHYTVYDSTTVLWANYIVYPDTCENGVGAISLIVSGGSGNYDYLWSTGNTTPSINGLFTGTYSVTVTDLVYSTVLTDNFQITSLGGSFNTFTVVTNASCSSCNDGIIDLVINGANNYQYIWSNSATTQDITNVLPGTYSVTITDNFNCDTVLTDSVDYLVHISDINNGFSLTVYPNPVYHKLTINYNLNNEYGYLRIYNAYGKNILNKSLDQKSGELIINTSDLATGIYYIELIGDQNRISKKIIKGR